MCSSDLVVNVEGLPETVARACHPLLFERVELDISRERVDLASGLITAERETATCHLPVRDQLDQQ